jgi:tetratricopeptide (TPR) repeat protein
MKKRYMFALLPALLLVALAIMLGGCGKKKDEGKIPVTSSSNEALSEFLEGRTLSDNLRVTDAIEHFQKALAKDPNFAMAHLHLAQAAGTNKELFDHLKQAVALSNKVSEGERLCILGLEAGTYRDPIKQRELYQQLATLFPTDERALMLLGTNYFIQQDYPKAAEYLNTATVVAPAFAPAYNQLGYSYLFLNRFAEAENIFKKYTELIPNDPNPYDSYAELLLKMGRFDEAITQYRKALSLDPKFIGSFNGIAAALMYEGKYDDALAETQKAYDAARNEGEQRTALFTKTVIYLDHGKFDLGLQEMENQYAISEKSTDVASMANDLIVMGSILLEMGKYDDARGRFDKAANIIVQSDLPPAVKKNAERFHHYYVAQIALMKKDFNNANAELDQFRQEAEAIKALYQIRLVHETRGTIALMQKNYDGTIAELEQANQQDPYNHYRIALAYEAKGNKEKAKQYFTQAAKFNGLPSLNYAFVRTKAEKMLAKS